MLSFSSFHSFLLFGHRISLAEAHCKLCLRTKVLEEDAVIAVLLCENSVTLKHGSSFFISSSKVRTFAVSYLHHHVGVTYTS